MPMRNQEAYLSELPKTNIQRSIFNKPFSHKTSFNCGDVIPFYIQEVVPSSTHQIRTSVVCRLQTLLTPIMDQLYLDTFYFFVPNRLVWDHWKNFCGENDNGPWTRDKQTYRVPVLYYPKEEAPGTKVGFDSGSIADYFGVPPGVWFAADSTTNDKNFPSALPFRAYALIINEFFRSTPLQQSIVVHKDDTSRVGVFNRTTVPGVEEGESYPWYITDLELGGKPFKAARFHDYFSSCLPQPQASEPVSIFGGFADLPGTPSWQGTGPFAPVITGSDHMKYVDGVIYSDMPDPIKLSTIRSGAYTETSYVGGASVTDVGSTDRNVLTFGNATLPVNSFVPANLYANLNIPEATISTLRLAFQMQKYFERLGSGGQRYREYLKSFFGCDNGDARMQIPEYLGGHRVPLSIHQVANTSQSSDSDLGDLGAMSNTSDVHEDFHMSFSEHGYIIGLACIRYDNTYSQGLECLWSRRDILDFYNPVFANISDMPVFGREISLGVNDVGGTPDPDRVFGYKPAWQEYRQMQNRCSGEMRPDVSNSLASWHLGDDYDAAPYLNETWIMTDETIVDRVLAVTSSVANQAFADFYVQDRATLPMPVFSVPGLADHF